MLLNRKQTRSILTEWKSFLSEANKKAVQSGVIIRLFDFDGTLSSHPNPVINRIISNPFMASMLNEKILTKYIRECRVPSDLQKILTAKASDNVKNYIISKVTSVGFPYNRAQVIAKTQEAVDDNFKALKQIVEENGLGEALAEGNAKKLSKVLNFPNVDIDPDSAKINNDHLLKAQELKIDEFLMKNKANIEKVYVKTNIAETSIDEKSGKVERIPGTSGKAEITQRLVKRILAENPGKKFTFEVYDNSTVGIAEVTEGVIVADDYVPNTTYINKREKDLFEDMFGQLQRSPNINFKKFFATTTEDGIEINDVSDGYFTKSKSKDADPQSRFKRIKNLFNDLVNFYAMGGRATGRKSDVNVAAIRKYFQDHHYDLLLEVLDNVYSHTRAAEDIVPSYSDPAKLNRLVDQIFSWAMDNENFKHTIKSHGGSFVEIDEPVGGDEEPVSPVAKAKTASRAKGKTTAQQMPDPTQAQQSVEKPTTGAVADQSGDEEDYADDNFDDNLMESLNKLRLILKKR